MINYTLVEVSRKLSEKYWDDFFKLREKQKSFLPHPNWTFEQFKDYILQDCEGLYIPEEDFHRFLVFNNKTLIGEIYSYLEDDKTENLGEIVYLRINILPQYHTDQLWTTIFSRIVKLYTNFNLIQLNTHNLLHHSWVKNWNGTLKLNIEEFRLYNSDINQQVLLENLTPINNNPELKIVFFEMDKIPDDLLRKYIDLWNNSLNDEPLGNFDFKFQLSFDIIKSDLLNQKDNSTTYSILLIDKEGDLIGFTDCYIEYEKSNKQKAFNLDKGMTGIRRDYRGKKLGKAIASKLYLKIEDDFEFYFIRSNMSPRNNYILDLNKEIGYKKTNNTSRQEYIFEIDTLRKLISENNKN